MWPFGRRNALDEREINWKEFGLLVETNPTKIYVNCLILHLYDGDRHPCVLRPSEPLPEVPHYDLDEQPPIQRVVNRLKVMAGLDRIIEAGGYITVDTGAAPDANLIPVPKDVAETAFDAAACMLKACEITSSAPGKAVTICGKCIEICPYMRRYVNIHSI